MLEKIQFNKKLYEFYGVYQQPDALQEAVYAMVEHIEKLTSRLHLAEKVLDVTISPRQG